MARLLSDSEIYCVCEITLGWRGFTLVWRIYSRIARFTLVWRDLLSYSEIYSRIAKNRTRGMLLLIGGGDEN